MASVSWFDIRDLFLNTNPKRPTEIGDDPVLKAFKEALRLMPRCDHPDAKLIVSYTTGEILKDKPMLTVSNMLIDAPNCIANVYGMLLKFNRGLCSETDMLLYLQRAITKHKHALSIAWLCWLKDQMKEPLPLDEAKTLLLDAQKDGERDAFYVYGYLFTHVPSLKRAFDMGYLSAGLFWVKITTNLLTRIEILGKMTQISASFGDDFFCCFRDVVQRRVHLTLEESYAFGKYLHGKTSDTRVFGYSRDVRIADVANVKVAFFVKQKAACKAAVDAFSLCAMRMKLYKDMRIYIAKFIWSTRGEALYE